MAALRDKAAVACWIPADCKPLIDNNQFGKSTIDVDRESGIEHLGVIGFVRCSCLSCDYRGCLISNVAR